MGPNWLDTSIPGGSFIESDIATDDYVLKSSKTNNIAVDLPKEIAATTVTQRNASAFTETEFLVAHPNENECFVIARILLDPFERAKADTPELTRETFNSPEFRQEIGIKLAKDENETLNETIRKSQARLLKESADTDNSSIHLEHIRGRTIGWAVGCNDLVKRCAYSIGATAMPVFIVANFLAENVSIPYDLTITRLSHSVSVLLSSLQWKDADDRLALTEPELEIAKKAQAARDNIWYLQSAQGCAQGDPRDTILLARTVGGVSAGAAFGGESSVKVIPRDVVENGVVVSTLITIFEPNKKPLEMHFFRGLRRCNDALITKAQNLNQELDRYK